MSISAERVDPEWIASQRAAGWPDVHPEDYCHRCGGRNAPSWSASREDWQTATTGWAAETGREGICCVRCFAELYEAATGESCSVVVAPWRGSWEAHGSPAPQAEGDVQHAVEVLVLEDLHQVRESGGGFAVYEIHEEDVTTLVRRLLSSGLVVPVAALDPFDEDGYCGFCGNGRWKHHGPECRWQDAIEGLLPSRIPARLLSGEHVGRDVVLPDGTDAALVKTEAYLVLTGERGVFARFIAPDDVVTLVAEPGGA